jgi:C4-dicarboxylate transporter/malic acid transport protein
MCANQSFCLYFYADALRQNVLVARTYSWSFLIYPDAAVRAQRGFMESGGRKTEAARPSGGMLRTGLNPAVAGSCEGPVIIEAALNPDGRSEVESPMSDRTGPRRRTAAPPICHIRRMKLETANPTNARGTLRDVIREFTPNWFSVTMGTGALALAINQIPLPIPGLYELAGGLWLLDILLFALFTVTYAARWIFFFDEARQIVRHPVLSMFLGAIPMGLATIINGLLIFGGGETAVWMAHGLWWLDVTMSVACGLLVPFLMFTLQDHSMERMTAVWLLPIVAAEVAAVSGALLVPHLSPSEALSALILCYALWAFSVPLAMSILVVLLLRLVLHKLPEPEMAASGWLALGPIGTGALALVLLGGDAPAVFAVAGLTDVGRVVLGFGIIGGTMLWGYGVWWLLLAILKTIRYLRDGMPFNLGCWGFTFPLGVYSLATLALARATRLGFFSVIGSILVACLAALWFVVTVLTVVGAWDGHLLVAPSSPRGRAVNEAHRSPISTA